MCMAATCFACQTSSQPNDYSCKAAVDQTMKLGELALAPLPKAQRDNAHLALPPMRDAMLKRCRDEKWDTAIRRCFIVADSAESIQQCLTATPKNLTHPLSL